jgi:hypothetical protein
MDNACMLYLRVSMNAQPSIKRQKIAENTCEYINKEIFLESCAFYIAQKDWQQWFPRLMEFYSA